MEVTPLTIFYGSMLGLIVAALFAVMYRQGRSPTNADLRDLERLVHETARETREELRAEINAAVRTAITEISAEFSAELHRQMADVHRRIDETNQRIDQMNQRIDQTNERIDRVLAALANHEHIGGRVMITVQPDAEPAPAAADD